MTSVPSKEVQSAFYHYIECSDVGEKTIYTFKPIGFTLADVEIQEGANSTPTMNAEGNRNMIDSIETMWKEKNIDDATIGEDFHSDIPDVSSKDVNMASSSNMDTQMKLNITSDLIMTGNISLSTTVVDDETLQPTVLAGEQTPDIASAAIESCMQTDMVDEVEDYT